MKRILCDVRAERPTSTPPVRPDVAKNSIEGNRRQHPSVMGIAGAVRAEKAGKKSPSGRLGSLFALASVRLAVGLAAPEGQEACVFLGTSPRRQTAADSGSASAERGHGPQSKEAASRGS